MTAPIFPDIIDDIYNSRNAAWEGIALDIFRYQYNTNRFYRRYCELLNIAEKDVNSLSQIPFLPIQFFKTAAIVSGDFEPELVFESSTTTGTVPSRHLVKHKAIYEQSFLKGFESFYGDPGNYCIIGLLPSYLQRGQSSLVYMVNRLIEISGDGSSGFYLDNYEALHNTLVANESSGKKTLLFGVTYALLEFSERFPMKLSNCIIMETGGMKGRREELTRSQVHHQLTEQLGAALIHSEYGMTELLSQAYSKGNGLFEPAASMKIFIRAEDDPFNVNICPPEKKFITGAINVIDLSNVYSCSFIATDDMGKLYTNGQFEVLGRLDNSDIRGCSLMTL